MLTEEEVNGMLVNQLKEELKIRGASILGKKAELASRLLELVKAGALNTSDEATDVVMQADESAEEVVSSPDTGQVGAHATNNAPIVDAEEQKLVPESSSTAPAPLQSDTISGEANTSSTATYTHVRIDNFQRPLNQKALIEWIEKTCQCTLSPESLWINSIKTHCYVDFQNYEEALRCVNALTGLRFPSTSAYTLEADFTSVSAKEAPGSAEGAMKPGEWKVPVFQSITQPSAESLKQSIKERKAAASAAKARLAEQTAEQGEEMETVIEHPAVEGSPAAPAVGSKRRIDAVESSAMAAAGTPGVSAGSGGAGENKSRRVAGLDIFRRATAGILFGGKPAPNTTSPRHGEHGEEVHTETPTVTGLVSRKARMLADDAHNAGVAGPIASSAAATGASTASTGQDNGVATEGLGLEDLFRKTVRASPALYWMPAPDEVVQQRLKSKLMNKSRK